VTLYEQLLRAWNEQNADAFGAVFAEDCSAVGFDGSTMNGRQEIVATLRGIFEHHRTATYVAKVREVRELGADVVLVRAVVGMRPPGAAELDPAVNAIQSVVMTGQGAACVWRCSTHTPAAISRQAGARRGAHARADRRAAHRAGRRRRSDVTSRSNRRASRLARGAGDVGMFASMCLACGELRCLTFNQSTFARSCRCSMRIGTRRSSAS
jgi:uncharacterized protein (TIGR02246 family)